MNKETTIVARITSQEKKLIQEKAKANKMKMSEYLRYAALACGTLETRITTEIKVKE